RCRKPTAGRSPGNGGAGRCRHARFGTRSAAARPGAGQRRIGTPQLTDARLVGRPGPGPDTALSESLADESTNDLGDSRLVERIRDEIEASSERRIPFARFMQLALTEPGLGYYATTHERPTRGGDFLTAPELHPFFGRLIGRQLAEVWGRLGEPAAFT